MGFPPGISPKGTPLAMSKEIRKGNDNAERQTYPARINPHSTEFWCMNGTWRYNWKQADGGRPVKLVEVWDKLENGRYGIWVHPSRNRFF